MSIKLNAASGGSVALDAPTQTTSSADNVYKLPVADGSAGQVLKTDGSGNLSWVSQPTGGYVKISENTISSSVGQIDIDFDLTTYDNFKVYLEGWDPSADCSMYVRFKIGGSISTSNYYSSLTLKKYNAGFDSTTYGGSNHNLGYLSDNVGGGADKKYSAQLDIMPGTGTGFPFLHVSSFYRDNGSGYAATTGVIGWQQFAQMQGIRLYPSTGNIDSGKYTVYGIK